MVILIGEAPGKNDQDCYPLYPFPKGSAGGRLLRLSPCWREDHMYGSMRRYLETTRRLNLVPYYPGSKWPTKYAEAQARNLCRSGFLADHSVVLVGVRVARAFFESLYKHLKFDREITREVGNYTGEFYGRVLDGSSTTTAMSKKFYWIPHPSGRNRLYNSEEMVSCVREVLQDAWESDS